MYVKCMLGNFSSLSELNPSSLTPCHSRLQLRSVTGDERTVPQAGFSTHSHLATCDTLTLSVSHDLHP